MYLDTYFKNIFENTHQAVRVGCIHHLDQDNLVVLHFHDYPWDLGISLSDLFNYPDTQETPLKPVDISDTHADVEAVAECVLQACRVHQKDRWGRRVLADRQCQACHVVPAGLGCTYNMNDRTKPNRRWRV